MKRLEHRSVQFEGMLPIGGDESYYNLVLFPIGRSDRMYIMLLPGLFGTNVYRIYCYQRNAGNVRLTYKVNLELKDKLATKSKPAKRLARITSLLDLITTETPVDENDGEHIETYAVKGRIGPFVKNDLAKKEDYVVYHYCFGTDELAVWELSNSISPNVEEYSLDKDPYTNVDLKSGDDFYNRYGLPVSRWELALMHEKRQ